ncbi:hypothetical protein Rsub_05214 [Raphidocelis subcapitata]|uniref:CARDB domain-containing protein n=1 Tax=Raphidocelis subcapitata TaxID=307507 RepID=A0A2V0P422_9CHLO|nr:hypothetical protein Rsub_05214 [Raphidocelis subcapitata]|eukprot:GBF92600.1 hypothetical protein Rsub_05214 [Raphidocelis subcapitata]
MSPRRAQGSALLLAAALVFTPLAVASAMIDNPISEELRTRIYWVITPNPSRPEPGGKFTWTLDFENLRNETMEGLHVALWANATEDQVKCGAAGADSSFTLSPVKPHANKRLTPKLEAPATLGPAISRVLFDADCKLSTSGAQYTVEYTVSDTPTWDLGGINDNPVTGVKSWQAHTTPQLLVAGKPFELRPTIFNFGKLKSPDGVTVGVIMTDVVKFLPNPWVCGSVAPNATFTVPKLGPGKSFEGSVMMTAPATAPKDFGFYLVVDPDCIYSKQEYPRGAADGVKFLEADMSTAPMPWFWGQQQKGTEARAFKTAPAKPKAGKAISVKVSFENQGSEAGTLGLVKIWFFKFGDALFPPDYPNMDDRCNYTDPTASATFADVIVEPGKHKKVTIKDVPAPTEPGAYYLLAQADADCKNPYSFATTDQQVVAFVQYSVFTVKLRAAVFTALAVASAAINSPLNQELRTRIYQMPLPTPSRPEPGGKFTWTLDFENLRNETMEGLRVALWANATEDQVNAQYTVEYTVSDTPTWDLGGINDNPVTGMISGRAHTTPQLLVAGKPFELRPTIFNFGKLKSPDGVTVGVFTAKSLPYPWVCGFAAPNATFAVPKLASGKSFEGSVTLTAPALEEGSYFGFYIIVDPDCKYSKQEYPRGAQDGVSFIEADVSTAPMPWFWGQQKKGTEARAFKTAPAKPKAGKAISVKLTFENQGSEAGALGLVKIWFFKFGDALFPPDYPNMDDRCNYTDPTASATFADVVVEPGKHKKVTIKDVPAPTEPGAYYLLAQADADCKNPYSFVTTGQTVVAKVQFSVFTVK